MQRRQLDLRSADDVLREIDRLQSAGYERMGNWSLTQICQHLDKTMTGGLEGFGFQLPWILRATIGNFFVRRILKNRRMGRFNAPKRVLPKVEGPAEDAAVIDKCRETIQRAAAASGPLPPYPLATKLSVEDWKQLQWIHASHHLGFLVPQS